MKMADLLAAKAGDIDARELLERTRRDRARLVAYFGRSDYVRARVTSDDLDAVARAETWLAVRDYRFRCQSCELAAKTREDLVAHEEERHGGAIKGPRPPINLYVQGRVGRALYHQARAALNRMGREAYLEEVAVRVLRFEAGSDRGLTSENAAEFALMVKRQGEDLERVRAGLRGLAGEVDTWLRKVV